MGEEGLLGSCFVDLFSRLISTAGQPVPLRRQKSGQAADGSGSSVGAGLSVHQQRRMVVCRFFLQGSCKFGANCKNEHPGQHSAASSSAAAGAFSADSIKLDLTTDRPIWALTSYGPAKHELNLIAGIDVSQEELRLEFYKARTANNPQLYGESWAEACVACNS